MNKSELLKRITKQVNKEEQIVEEVVEATLEEIYQSLKNKESVNLRNFGTFYINQKRGGTVFKFNPSQRLRKLFDWSSSYKGE